MVLEPYPAPPIVQSAAKKAPHQWGFFNWGAGVGYPGANRRFARSRPAKGSERRVSAFDHARGRAVRGPLQLPPCVAVTSLLAKQRSSAPGTSSAEVATVRARPQIRKCFDERPAKGLWCLGVAETRVRRYRAQAGGGNQHPVGEKGEIWPSPSLRHWHVVRHTRASSGLQSLRQLHSLSIVSSSRNRALDEGSNRPCKARCVVYSPQFHGVDL